MDRELIGIWSADHMYIPNAQSDEILIFCPDMTGRFEFINFRLCSVDLFQWKILTSNRISLKGFKRLELDEDARHIIESSSDFQFPNISYQIEKKMTKSGKVMRVLEIKLFDLVADHYGFVREDLTGYEEPDFQLY